MNDWYVYLVRRGDGALYTGITTDVSRRLDQHQQGGKRGAKSLRGKGPLSVALTRKVGSKALALSVEDRIKRLSHARKEALVERVELLDRLLDQARERHANG